MIYGHGDDLFSYPDIRANFSSNCYYGADRGGLEEHLQRRLPHLIANYPHPDGYDLKELIARKRQLSVRQTAVFNGATEAIYTIAGSGHYKQAYVAGPTFSEYEAASLQHHIPVIRINLKQLICEMDYPFADESCVWICNPNNPDGTLFPAEQLIRLMRRFPNVRFIVDQSYADFTDQAVLDCSDLPENGLLIYSLTKQYSIPGLRLGYVIGSEEWIGRLSDHKMPWSVNALALEAGKYLLTHTPDFQKMRKELRGEVLRMQQAFTATNRIETIPSATHYFLSRLPSGNANLLKETLARKHGLLIRNAENFSPDYGGYFRIAVRSPKENNWLIEALTNYVTYL